MKNLVFFTYALTFLFHTACSKDSSKSGGTTTEGTFNGAAYIVIDAGDLQRTETSIKGSGSIGFKDPASEIGSKNDYALKFAVEDGGYVTLLTNADKNLDNGVKIVLTRSGTELTATLAVGDKKTSPKTMAGVDASSVISINADVHNDENPSHILIWSGSDYEEDKALLNSEVDEETPGQGSGTFWGLVLAKATVTSAIIEAPKFVEE